MEDANERSRVRVGPQGRVVIPARIRRALSIGVGDTLVARAVGGRIVLEKRADVLGRAKRRFADVPDGVSLADELISERRGEARRDASG